MATREEINRCLFKVKRLISEKHYRVAERKRFLDDLTDISITIPDAICIIHNLMPANYWRGPTQEFDSDYPDGDVWEFTKQYEGKQLYIKFKIYNVREGEILHIFRFHISRES